MNDFSRNLSPKLRVAAELNKMSDPEAATASLVKQTIAMTLEEVGLGRSDPDRLIEMACREGSDWLMLAEQDGARGAVLILEAVSQLASARSLDQAASLRSAVRGLTRLNKSLGTRTLRAVREKIEDYKLGAGEYFAELLERATQTTDVR